MKRLLIVLFITWSLQSSAQEVTIKDRFIIFITETYRISNAPAIVETVFALSKEKNLDPTLIFAIIATESRFQDRAKSPAQSYGLMQVHWPSHKKKFDSKDEIFDIDYNIDVGTDIWISCTNKARSLIQSANCYTGGHQKWLANVQRNQQKFKQLYKDI